MDFYQIRDYGFDKQSSFYPPISPMLADKSLESVSIGEICG